MKIEAFKAYKDGKVLKSMIRYLNYKSEDCHEFEAGYSQNDIDKCGHILNNYVDRLIICGAEESKNLECVESVVTKLNNLNVKCNCRIIETDQREDLCDFIEEAAKVAGLAEQDCDITEEWREW